jgi:hypothetical protein
MDGCAWLLAAVLMASSLSADGRDAVEDTVELAYYKISSVGLVHG